MPQLGHNSALRRLFHPVYRRLETDVHPLRYLFLEITQACNLACLHCGSDCGREPGRQELDLKDWLDFFDYLAKNFDRKQLAVVLTGGEPFCHPQFGRIIKALHKNGLFWGMVTNGYTLNEAAAKKIVKEGISSITVSLDGLKESHDWLRGRKGSFEKAVQAIRNIVAADIPLYDVVTCVNPRNLLELPEILDLLRDLGVKNWRIFTIFPKGRAKTNTGLIMMDEQIELLINWIARVREKSRKTDFSLNFSCEGYFPAKIDKSIRDEPYFCRAGISIGSVLCDGSISACPNISRKLTQGNIRNDDFKRVWEMRFNKFRDRSWLKTGECAGCSQWKRCLGNSMHLLHDDTLQTGRCFYRILRSQTR